jgi:hypothetical protein
VIEKIFLKEELNMRKIHISQFYACSEISLGSEMYYLCEVAKNLSKHDMVLSLDGVILHKDLEKSMYYLYFLDNIKKGLIVDTNISKFPPIIEVSGIYDEDLMEEEHQPIFTEQNDNYWLFDLKGKCPDDLTQNILRFNGTYNSQAWVSIIAYVSVNRFLTGIPTKFEMKFDYSVTYQSMATADIILLMEDTNALQGWFELKVNNELQAYYEAWFKKWQEKGYMQKSVSIVDKFEYLIHNNFKKGCPVFLYQRENKRKNDNIKSIKNCNIAVIRDLNKTSITLEIVPRRETRYMTKVKYDSYGDDVKALFGDKYPWNQKNTRYETFDLTEIGVDMLMFREEYFISNVDKDDMLVLTDIPDGGDEYDETKIELSCQQAVYWILKDWDIEFDSDWYVNTFLKEGKAVYNIFNHIEN